MEKNLSIDAILASSYGVVNEMHALSEVCEEGAGLRVLKIQTLIMAAMYERAYCRYGELGKNYSPRLTGCATDVDYLLIKERKQDDKYNYRLKSANFCRVRTCPICQWRRALLWKAKFHAAIPKIMEQYPTAQFVFLTLTVKNCDIDELGETLKKMHTGFRNMVRRDAFKNAVIGWIRTTEVTKPQNSNTKAHPHYHVLLMVRSNYFTKAFIRQDEWRQMWKECCNLDYDPIIDVRKVKPKSEFKDIDEPVSRELSLVCAAAETLKYAVKPSDLLADDDWLMKYTIQTHRKRFVDSGGVLKNVLGKSPETEDGKSVVEFIAEITYYWHTRYENYYNRRPPRE